MALTDGIKNKLKVVANAIRSKTNKSGNLTLEQMASEVSDIDTLQGLDFSEIYDSDFNPKFNTYYQYAINRAKQLKLNWDTNTTNIITAPFRNDLELVLVPNLDFTNVQKASSAFKECYNLEYIGELKNFKPIGDIGSMFYQCLKLKSIDELNLTDSVSAPNIFYFCISLEGVNLKNTNKINNFNSAFAYCTLIKELELNTDSCTNLRSCFLNCFSLKKLNITSVENCTDFTTAFNNDAKLNILLMSNWKQANISLAQSIQLSAESIKYIIWYALNGDNTLGFENQGATSRTLQLHVTPYNSWGTWKLTKPSVEDCEYLGVSEEEITKYGELTWEDIALNVKLITIAK